MLRKNNGQPKRIFNTSIARDQKNMAAYKERILQYPYEVWVAHTLPFENAKFHPEKIAKEQSIILSGDLCYIPFYRRNETVYLFELKSDMEIFMREVEAHNARLHR